MAPGKTCRILKWPKPQIIIRVKYMYIKPQACLSSYKPVSKLYLNGKYKSHKKVDVKREEKRKGMDRSKASKRGRGGGRRAI